jgi:hypothetical protein
MKIVLVNRHGPSIRMRSTACSILGYALAIQIDNDKESGAVFESAREGIAFPCDASAPQNVDILLRLGAFIVANLRVIGKPT